MASDACPIWGTPAAKQRETTDWIQYDSPRAGGVYRIVDRAAALVERFSVEEKARLTTWIIDQHRSGEPEPTLTFQGVQTIRARRPISYSDKKDRFFLGLAEQNWSFRDTLRLSGAVDDTQFRNKAFVAGWTEIADDRDISAFMRLLIDETLVEVAAGEYRLTSRGFQQLEASERGGLPSSQGFVAMWFDHALDAAFEEGIAPAIRRAGFDPLRIDKREHNNKIDDEIITQIKKSKFIVADFTCGRVADAGGTNHWLQRGGVYFETGFAYGLGIPVIWTCRNGDENGMHFDTRQFPHILWSTPEDLEGALYNRIIHVVGEGPNAMRSGG